MLQSVSPNIFVSDMDATIQCYRNMGFEVAMSVPETGAPVWVMMTLGSVSFMFQTLDSVAQELPEMSRNGAGSLLLYIQMKGLRAFHDRIKDLVKVIKPIETTFYGATEFSVLDVNGYVLTFAEDE